jgi:hypothetical protein
MLTSVPMEIKWSKSYDNLHPKNGAPNSSKKPKRRKTGTFQNSPNIHLDNKKEIIIEPRDWTEFTVCI